MSTAKNSIFDYKEENNSSKLARKAAKDPFMPIGNYSFFFYFCSFCSIFIIIWDRVFPIMLSYNIHLTHI